MSLSRRTFFLLFSKARPKEPPTDIGKLNAFARAYNIYGHALEAGKVDLKAWERLREAWERL